MVWSMAGVQHLVSHQKRLWACPRLHGLDRYLPSHTQCSNTSSPPWRWRGASWTCWSSWPCYASTQAYRWRLRILITRMMINAKLMKIVMKKSMRCVALIFPPLQTGQMTRKVGGKLAALILQDLLSLSLQPTLQIGS